MIDSIAYDMIENIEASKMVDFLRMMDDYKDSLYLDEMNKESDFKPVETQDFSDDLPF